MEEIMKIALIIVLIVIFFILFFIDKIMQSKEKYILIILAIICTNINVSMNYSQTFSYGESYVYISLTTFVILMIFICRLNTNSIRITLDKICLILILINIIACNNNINDIGKFVSICELYICILLIAYIYSSFKYYDYTKILKFFRYLIIFNGILGILQFITNKKLLFGRISENINYGEGITLVRRTVGIAGSNNSAGNLGAILFSIALFNYMRTKKKIDLFALILTLIFSILTFTRIGYVAIIVETFIYFVISNWSSINQILKKLRILFYSIILGFCGLILFGNKLYDILFIKRGDTSQWRQIQFSRVFNEIIPNNTFFRGIGPGQYIYYSTYMLQRLDIDIHSQYINILVEQGTFAFIVFIIFNIYVSKKALKKCENKSEKIFIISLLIGNLIVCNYNPNQYYLINNIIYYLLVYCFVYKKDSGVIKLNK